jgi:hypothetical protein
LARRQTSQQPEPSSRTEQQQSTNLLLQQWETKTKGEKERAAVGEGKNYRSRERREKQKQKSTRRGVYLSMRRDASKQRDGTGSGRRGAARAPKSGRGVKRAPLP